MKGLALKSELGHIERLIDQIISFGLAETIANERVQFFQQSVLMATDRIRNLINDQFLSAGQQTTRRRLFQFYARSIVSLLDHIQEKTVAVESGTSTLTEWAYSTVEDLLNFLRNQFHGDLDHGLTAPKRFTHNFLVKLEDGVVKLHERLSDSEVDAKIRELIVETFRRIPRNVSYAQLFYLQLLLTELLRVDWSGSDPQTKKQDFINTLIKLNFNDPSFVAYYAEHMTVVLTVCETLMERIERLGYFMKLVNQTYVMPGVSSNPSLPGIQTQILEWLSHEMDYCQLQLSLAVPKDELHIKKDFKLIFDMSVANLAFLFKLFIETGVVQNKNTSEVIRFLTKFVKTKKSETVSYESFRIKYYNTESGTKDAVKKILQTLMNSISKN